MWRVVVEEGGVVDQLAPACHRLHVDLDHAGVGGDAQHLQARVARRLVAFQHHRHLQLRARGLDRGGQFQVILQVLQGRHEYVHHAVARLGAHRRAGDPAGRFQRAGAAVGGRRGRCFAAARTLGGLGGARVDALPAGRAAIVGHRHRGARCVAPRFQQVRDIAVRRQRLEMLGRVRRVDIRIVGLAHPGLRIERQAIAHRRIARDQVAALGPQEPRPGDPGTASAGAAYRQHVPGHFIETLGEYLAQTFALQRVVQARFEGVDIDRQAALAPQVIPGVLVGLEDEFRVQSQARGEGAQKAPGLHLGHAVIDLLVGEQFGVGPDRIAVVAPEAGQRPARQLLARVPLALSVVQQAAGRVACLELVQQHRREAALGRSHRVGIPFGAVAVVDRDEGRLAAHGQAHVLSTRSSSIRAPRFSMLRHCSSE